MNYPLRFLTLALLTASLLTACVNEQVLPNGFSEPVDISTVPAQAINFIDSAYNGLTIIKIEKKFNHDSTFKKYEVYLSDGTEIYFDINWVQISGDDDDDHGDDHGSGNSGSGHDDDDDDHNSSGFSILIDTSMVPVQVLNYIDSAYAGLTIIKIEKKLNADSSFRKYEIYLSDGTTLYFDINWVQLSDDDDDDHGDDDDDDHSGSGSSGNGGDDHVDIALADLPQAAQTYLTQNYPNVSIKRIRKYMNNAGVVVEYEVRLNNGKKLYFSPAGLFVRLDD